MRPERSHSVSCRIAWCKICRERIGARTGGPEGFKCSWADDWSGGRLVFGGEPRGGRLVHHAGRTVLFSSNLGGGRSTAPLLDPNGFSHVSMGSESCLGH